MRLVRGIARLAESLRRRPAACLGYLAGIAVPLMLAGLVIVAHRGYGIMDQPPRGPQVYTSF
ncbi:MAG: hypothetical protein RIE24_07445 [Silicimonas sp.]